MYTRRFIIGKPRYNLYLGRWLWLTGKQEQGIKSWEKGIKASGRLEMPYDIALLQYELGSRLQKDDSRRQSLLESALKVFGDLDAPLDKIRTQTALD
jgi:hypothetical protein